MVLMVVSCPDAYGAMPLRFLYAMSGTDIAYGATPETLLRHHPPYCPAYAAIGQACYAMPGTDIARGAIGPRACYAMSSTELACGAIGIRTCYAMSGTELAYGPLGGPIPHAPLR
eukprot:56869-Rhodomonas_salina.3